MKLILPGRLRDRIEEEARALFPHECCGLIEGLRDEHRARAVALYPARNLAGGPNRFEIHPEDHFAALKTARNNGNLLIGCYHSHPHGLLRPSASDLEGAGEDGFLWLIAALDDPEGAVDLGAFAYLCSSRTFVVADLVEADAAFSRR